MRIERRDAASRRGEEPTILELSSDGRLLSSVPPPWQPFVRTSTDRLEVNGDPTAETNVFIHCGVSWAAVASHVDDLVAAMRERGEPVEISSFGVSSLLHNGFVPIPDTIFEGIHHLSMGEVAVVRSTSGGLRLDIKFSYPWLREKSRGTNKPDTGRLLELLTRATAERVESAGGRGVLMLSSGKDSSAVALALAESGLNDVDAVTYSTGPDDPEPPVAAHIARRLGLRHHVTDLSSLRESVPDALIRFFEANAMPGTDLSQIPYVLAVAAVDGVDGTVLDGGGNDPYMGYPPKGRDLAKLRYRIRGRRIARAVQHLTPVDSPWNYAARSAAEATLPGRTPRMRHVASLYPDAVDVGSWWYNRPEASGRIEPIRVYAEVSERHTHPTQTVMKQRLAARALGMTSSLPWADRTIAEYYFHLPEEHRYDMSSGKNKVLLRHMLAERMDYDASAVGKHYFEFDGPRFVAEYREFIWSEIESSPLWDPEGLPMVRRWLDGVEDRPLLYHAILTVFMVSGWSNHGPHRATPTSGGHRTAGTDHVG